MSEPESPASASAPRPRSGSWLVGALAVTLCLAAGALIAESLSASGPEAARLEVSARVPIAEPLQAELPAVASAPPSVLATAATAPLVLVTTEGAIGRGETLARSLGKQGVSAAVVHAIAREMSPVFNFRYARPGDAYELVQDADGDIVRFHYARSSLESYTLLREGEGFRAERSEPDIQRRHSRIAGVVSSSLYDSISHLGEQPELANDFAEIFAWDVDFSRSVRRGDEFSILYERMFLNGPDGGESYIGPGRILAARYSNRDGDYEAFYFEPSVGVGGYYRADGSSVERQFLKAPLKYNRISSRYSPNRLHPILKIRRPHLGIDYAAPRGTPVWSVADGEVIHRGSLGGFGKTVKVRHANGFVSYYGHLSRYPNGLRVGQRVRQKQVIGFVGSTGLSTGPHLDFRLKQNGKYLNPASLRTPAGDPIPEPELAQFAESRDLQLQDMDPRSIVVVTSEAL